MTIHPPAAVPHARGPERRDEHGLLAQALDAYREGRVAPAPPPLPGPTDGQLNDELLVYAFGRLARAEQASLARAGELRDRALTLARGGQGEEAEAHMKLARFYLSMSTFSPVGRMVAETLQQAAEAYLSYRRGDWADAAARMEASVGATNRLADAWGESRFTTGRRIHLLHNLMKVHARRGAAREAGVLGAGILAHLAMTSTGPRLAALDRPALRLEPALADKFSNVVAGTLAEVLAGMADAEAGALLEGVEPGEAPSAACAWAWLRVRSTAAAGDTPGLLGRAAPFLRAGRGHAPVLWYAVALEVARASHRLRAADAVAEIAAELASDPDVPRPIQAAIRSLAP